MKKKLISVLIIVLLTVNVILVTGTPSKLPAFPGAEGFGAYTRAAYAGDTNPTIYRVTNTNDGGPGSLRYALESSGPRIVIFEVSGTIQQNNYIWIDDPYVFVAGQTAPSPGITLRGPGALHIGTHDVVVQHLRIRVGDDSYGVPYDWRDGLNIDDSAHDIIIDHCSISWATDENAASGWYSGDTITFQWCIISEGLLTTHQHSMGVLIGPKSTKLSLHHNLFVHNSNRNPLIGAYGETEIINNVIYNWEWGPTGFYHYDGADPQYSNIISNYYKAGINTKEYHGVTLSEAESPSKFYIHDNIGPTRPTNNEDDWDIVDFKKASFRSNVPTFIPTGITTQNAFDAYDIVLNKAGARPADRDSVDIRIIKEVRDRTGQIIKSQNDVGGWPELEENHRTLLIPSDPHGDSDGDGYTNLEEWLHSYSKQVENVNIPRNRKINTLLKWFNNFFENHPFIYKLLKRLFQQIGL